MATRGKTTKQQAEKAAPVSRDEVKTSQGYYVQPEVSEASLPVLEAGFLERFSWKDFFCYGAIWIVIFFAFHCVCRIGGIISDQRRQINELIDRLNQYEDYSPSPPFDRDNSDESDTDLAAWVKKNLPDKKIEERPAVAEVFGNLADMLEAGTLTGESDTFSEGIAQLQPVATRSVWLPFLTKLTKRLKAAKLDSDGLAAACRTVSRAIYTPLKRAATNAPLLLLEGAKIPLTGDTPEKPSQDDSQGDSDKSIKLPLDAPNPSLIADKAPQNEDKPAQDNPSPETPEKSAAGNKDCPSGTCPVNQNQNSGYYGGYGWRYW